MKNLLFILAIFCFVAINYAQEIEFENAEFTKVADGLNFPEGIIFDYNNNIYFSSVYGGWIGKVTNEKLDTLTSFPTKPYDITKTNGLAINSNGTIYGCEHGKGSIFTYSTDGKCDSFIIGYNGKKFNRPNDICFTPDGNIYFTDPNSYDVNKLDGIVYYIDVNKKEVKPAFEGLGFPNGIAVGPCKKFLFVCESAKQRVLRFKINPDNTLSDSTVVVNLPGGDPDGIAFDTEGNLYIAHFGASEIVVVNPNNEIIRRIKTPGKKPSNIEFAGKDLKTIYITEDETNSIYKFNNNISGFKLFSSPN